MFTDENVLKNSGPSARSLVFMPHCLDPNQLLYPLGHGEKITPAV